MRLSILSFLIMILPISAFAVEMSLGNQALKKCWDTQQNHVEVNQCMSDEAITAKQAMTKAYDAELAAAKKMQAEFKAMKSAQYQDLVNSLTDSQKAFLNYMGKECGRAVESYGAGNGAGEGYFVCQIDLLNERTKRLISKE